ncbi:MAG: hypothetical protein Q8M19_13780 [Reyranella sp.]|nr:hypothetical protein [Reyranella sp.]
MSALFHCIASITKAKLAAHLADVKASAGEFTTGRKLRSCANTVGALIRPARRGMRR